MNQKKITLASLLFVLSTTYTLAQNPATCLEKAMTQSEMNKCTNVTLKQADAELNRIYGVIQENNAKDKLFLTKLKAAQRAWMKLRDADFELQFPHSKDPSYYGSVFPTCASSYKTDLTLKRVEFLKGWLIGVPEGEVCAGSKPKEITDDLPQVDEDTIKEVCFSNPSDSTELELSINYGDGTVKGKYNYLPAEKDQRIGKLDGSLWKGAISAKYTFEQEGISDTVNVRINLKDDMAVIQEQSERKNGFNDQMKQVVCK